MVDVQCKVIVHRLDGESILQVFGQEALVSHVVVQGIVQLNVDIAHQSTPHFLKSKKRNHILRKHIGNGLYFGLSLMQQPNKLVDLRILMKFRKFSVNWQVME